MRFSVTVFISGDGLIDVEAGSKEEAEEKARKIFFSQGSYDAKFATLDEKVVDFDFEVEQNEED